MVPEMPSFMRAAALDVWAGMMLAATVQGQLRRRPDIQDPAVLVLVVNKIYGKKYWNAVADHIRVDRPSDIQIKALNALALAEAMSQDLTALTREQDDRHERLRKEGFLLPKEFHA